MEQLPFLRREYRRDKLDEMDVSPDPISQFSTWLEEAIEALTGPPWEANAMALATVDAHGRPSCRTVLLKGVDARGFVFYTNFGSRKGRDIAANPHVALTFRWDVLERQVSVAGRAEPVPDEESDAYFATRPQGSQVAAWASPQSQVVPDRATLEGMFRAARDRFTSETEQGRPVPRPPHWGGYVVAPDTVELWQGRRDRLHDRLRYRRTDDGWVVERLAP